MTALESLLEPENMQALRRMEQQPFVATLALIMATRSVCRIPPRDQRAATRRSVLSARQPDPAMSGPGGPRGATQVIAYWEARRMRREGSTHEEIGKRLGVSRETVRHWTGNVLQIIPCEECGYYSVRSDPRRRHVCQECRGGV